MTVHVLVAEPPRAGCALPALVDGSADGGGIIRPAQAVTLAEAMIQDAALAVANSGGDLVVSHPTEDELPEPARTGTDPADDIAALLEDVIRLDDVRFEPREAGPIHDRGDDPVTRLLQDGEHVAVLDGRAPTLDHTALDSAAMKLRRHGVVVGPAPGARLAYLGLTAPVGVGGHRSLPVLPAAINGAVDAGQDVGFLPLHPRVDDELGLATVVALIQARRAAGRRTPPNTAAAVESLGLQVDALDGRARVRTESTDRA